MTTMDDIFKDIEKFAKRTLRYKSLDRVKTLLEKEGFETSKIIKYKGISRITAKNSDRNRIEVIFCEKDKYCIYNPSFSNANKDMIKVVSTNDFDPIKEIDEMNEEVSPFYYILDGFKREGNNPYFSYRSIFYRKNFAFFAGKSNKMASVNEISNIRNLIFEKEISSKKLINLKDISGQKKRKKLDKISKEIIKFFFDRKENYGLWTNPSLPKFFEKEFVIGYFLIKELFLKYSYSDKDIEDFFFEDVDEYLFLILEEEVKRLTENYISILKTQFETIEQKEIDIEYEKSKTFIINMEENFMEFFKRDRRARIDAIKNKEKYFQPVPNARPISTFEYEDEDEIPF